VSPNAPTAGDSPFTSLSVDGLDVHSKQVGELLSGEYRRKTVDHSIQVVFAKRVEGMQ
jgi:hypothetical protein